MLNSAAKVLLVLVTLLFYANNLKAQDISMEQTLEYINKKLSPHSNLDVIRGMIVAKYFDGGTLVREDQVLCKLLDLNTMRYDTENKLFNINCTGSSKCVDRQLLIRKIQRDYNRLSFPVNLDSKGSEGMKKAFTHMTRLVLDPKYKSSEPFE